MRISLNYYLYEKISKPKKSKLKINATNISIKVIKSIKFKINF